MPQEMLSAPSLTTTRTPVGPDTATTPKTLGEQAFKDAIILIVVAWLILFFLFFSLRRHNV
jgi:hypothetical protein